SGCPVISELRMRVNISAIGSLTMKSALLPTRLDHARDFPLERQFPEMTAAQAKLADVRARPATGLARIRVYELAAITHLYPVFPPPFAGGHRFFRHQLILPCISFLGKASPAA